MTRRSLVEGLEQIGDVPFMQPSHVGSSLKAARLRLGWSREALAYHSGVSWSAIAQIETGRRKDLRLSSLAALAEALEVSVDYLIGPSRTTPDLLQHRLLSYASEDEFLTGAVPYLVAGVERAHSVLVVTTREVTDSVRDTLVDHREQIEFSDWADWYRSPQEALRRYGAFVSEKYKAGAAWITVVAEGWVVGPVGGRSCRLDSLRVAGQPDVCVIAGNACLYVRRATAFTRRHRRESPDPPRGGSRRCRGHQRGVPDAG